MKENIKFRGYSNKWEYLPFNDVFKEYSEKRNAELPVLTVVQGKGTVRRDLSGRVIHYDAASLNNYKIVKKHDFILHLRSFEGGLEVANEEGLVSPAYHLFHGNNVDSRFYYPLFRSKYFINVLLQPCVYGIRDGRSIDIDEMGKILIPVPLYKEQKQIGAMLETLDSKIESEKTEVEKLKALKAAMLVKMFPKEGEKVPEVRFKGFDGEWKKRTLSQISDYIREFGTGINYVGTDNMYKHCGGVDFSNDSEKNGIKYRTGDVLVSNIRPYLEKAWLADRNGVCSTDVIVFRFTECTPEFGYTILSNKKFFNYVMTAVGGSKMPRGDRNHIAEMNVMIPPTSDEMSLIAKTLRVIEKKTKLHERKYEKLIDTKKALLEKLIGGEA